MAQKQKRIFEIAKELGVDSKIIVAKCHAEGIPETTVKGHMSSVSAGLEATIREWFSVQAQEGGTATAVETAEKVDLEHVRTKGTRRKAKASSADSAAEVKPLDDASTAAADDALRITDTPAHTQGTAPSSNEAVSSASPAQGASPAAPQVSATPPSSQPAQQSSTATDAGKSAKTIAPSGIPATPRTPVPFKPLPPKEIKGPTIISGGRNQPPAAPIVDPTQQKAKPFIPTAQPTSSIATRPAWAYAKAAPESQPPAKSDSAPADLKPNGSLVTPHVTPVSTTPASPDVPPRTPPGHSQPASSLSSTMGPSTTRPSTNKTPKPVRPAPGKIEATVMRAPTGVDQPLSSLSPTSPAAPTAPANRAPTRENRDTRETRESTTPPNRTDTPSTDGGGGSEPATGSQHSQRQGNQTGRGAPAPMNVPSRPMVIAPAGPKLEAKSQVRIAGPKVVRVEAPEQIEAPRPRRVSTGGGPGTRPEGGGEERGRRNGGGAPGGAGAPGSGVKRSTGTGVPDRRRGRSDAGWASTQIFSEKDLIEREERLARSGGFLKKRKQDAEHKAHQDHADESPFDGRIRISAPFTIKDLSAATGVKGSEIVKKLFMQGIMKKINDAIDPDKASEIMMDFDIDLEITAAQTAEETVSSDFANREIKDLRPRGPIVTILGHVDHGKTSLLDRIRNANVAAGEAGGITQKTSAFAATIDIEGEKKEVIFLDTPGHEAFTSMRSRGAKMTDVIVLVVSAPEGVMPQTIESINHAKAAKVPIVVALNKIDRPDATEAQIQRTLGQLASAGLNPQEWGGDTEVIRVSAVTGQGIPQLLEVLDLQAQVLELKADFAGNAQGTVVESKMEEGRGAVANLLIQQGQLKVGDFVVMGRGFGRIRDITDDRGKRIKSATPPMAVQVSGIDEVCDAGDKFYVVDSLKKALEAAEQRRQRERHLALAQPKITLDNIFNQITDKEVKEILVVLKTDQQGTVDVLRAECEKVKSEEVKVRVLHAAVGGITESDILLADASRAIVIGFNVIPSGKARQLAENKGIEIRTYQVIYDITDDLKKAAEGLLAPELREEVLGHAEVRQVFRISKVGSIAGCYITDGTVLRDAFIRVTRNGVVVEHDRKLSQLKRLKDDAKEVRSGMECGMKIDGYDDIKEGDVLECYKKTEVKRTL